MTNWTSRKENDKNSVGEIKHGNFVPLNSSCVEQNNETYGGQSGNFYLIELVPSRDGIGSFY